VATQTSTAAGAGSGLWQGLTLRLAGLNPVSALVGMLQQPTVRESAQEQLRRELQGRSDIACVGGGGTRGPVSWWHPLRMRYTKQHTRCGCANHGMGVPITP
jgi:hypothetical protein